MAPAEQTLDSALRRDPSDRNGPPSVQLRWLLLLAVCFPLIHALAYPYAVYLHPDTTGLVIAGEALADEGRVVQPFRWDYIFEVSGRAVVSADQPVVNLDDDLRVGGIIYPPGYSWIVAAGRFSGLTTSQACRTAFCLTLAFTSFCWLVWAQRSGVPLTSILIGLSTLLAIGPSTVTDPFGWLAAVIVLLIVTFEFRIWLVVLATLVMVWADLIRHAAILVGAAWFWLWMTRRISLSQRLVVCVSCTLIVLIDLLAKYLRTGGLDPMSLFKGGWPEAGETLRATYYAILGGWSPAASLLKGAVGLCAGLGLVGLLLRPRTTLNQRWICDLVILQGATAFVLAVAQYRYGADFTKAPVAIARYWRYCAPGLVCAHLFGLQQLLKSVSSAGRSRALIVQAVYAGVILASVAQLLMNNRAQWSANVTGSDGFGRRPRTAEVHQRLQAEPDLSAVVTDNHQLVFTAVEPRLVKCLYYMTGFSSDSGGRIALVTSSTERGQATVAACDAQLRSVSSVDVNESVAVRIYELPPRQTVMIAEEPSAIAPATVDKRPSSSNPERSSGGRGRFR